MVWQHTSVYANWGIMGKITKLKKGLLKPKFTCKQGRTACLVNQFLQLQCKGFHTHTPLPHKAWAAKRCSLIGFLAVMDTRRDWLKGFWDNLPYRDLFSRHRMDVAKNISTAQRFFEKPSSLSKIFLILVGLPHQFLFLFALFLSQFTLFQQLAKNATGRAKE